MTPPEPRYRIEVSETQARHLRDACELMARVRMGQVADACREVLDADGKYKVPYEIARQAECLIKAAVGLAPNQSWGVAKHEAADIPWEMYQSIRYRLAWDYALDDGLANSESERDWARMMSVDYDRPMKLTREPEMKIERIKETGYPFIVGQHEEESE